MPAGLLYKMSSKKPISQAVPTFMCCGITQTQYSTTNISHCGYIHSAPFGNRTDISNNAIKKLKNKKYNVIDLFIEAELCSSKSEARRLVKQNGLSIDAKVVEDINMEVDVSLGVLLK